MNLAKIWGLDFKKTKRMERIRLGKGPGSGGTPTPYRVSGKVKRHEAIYPRFSGLCLDITRMQIRRFTRLTNSFSKKLKNLKCALGLHFFHYNFVRIHQTLRITPAMASGITDHIWGWDDVLAGS